MKPRTASIALFVVFVGASIRADNRNTYPLPEDRGTAGIYEAFRKLPVYVRVLYTTAHPDDENGAMLTWLAREAHARTALFSLTRGDGGQNILGSEKYEALALVRTGELLEACKLYGVELYFSTAFEFGFSRGPDETLTKWGHEKTLEEMVRMIRRFRPAIIVSAFRGTEEDGHGHHQAAGIVTHEAFRAAGDAHRFPEQFNDGLVPWQAKRLYESAGRRSNPGPGVVTIPSGDLDPILGRSPREIGSEGYSKHRTQGNGATASMPFPATESYRLVDRVTAEPSNDDGLFAGIDTSLPSIMELAGSEAANVAPLREKLAAAQKDAEVAAGAVKPDRPWESASVILHGLAAVREGMRIVGSASLSASARARLLDALNQKELEFQRAIEAVAGIRLIAVGGDQTAVPGQSVSVTVTLANRGRSSLEIGGVRLQTVAGNSVPLENETRGSELQGGHVFTFHGSIALPADTPPTQPFWYRENAAENRFHTRKTPDPFAPFDPPTLSAEATYRLRGTEFRLSAPVQVQAGDPMRGSDFVDLQVVPTLSVQIQPGSSIIPASSEEQVREFQVSILNNREGAVSGSINLIPPAGWKIEPSAASFSMARKGETSITRLSVHAPRMVKEGAYRVEAVATLDGREYHSGYTVVSYPENWTRNLYAPSISSIQVFQLKTAPGLTVGYVPGSGDEVLDSIARMGIRVEKLSGLDLALADLSRFSAIVTGVRAYNVNADLRAHNARLLQYVERGGTLIVQYVRPMTRTPAAPGFPYGPYPMSNSDEARITDEGSPVEILDTNHTIFTTPNKITPADFSDWVQERGTYFMTEWDPRYTPLLSGHDPGFPALKGGMLVTRYGKGWYMYSAYAWFRQLPAGVPGAYRIFANMLSLGN